MKKLNRREFIKLGLTASSLCALGGTSEFVLKALGKKETPKKVIVLGLDGMDPHLVEMLMEQGEVCNANLRDYKVTTTIDIPSIQDTKSLIVAAPNCDGPFGAKGLGEAVLVALAPAISNAIYDGSTNATGSARKTSRAYNLPEMRF